jgi:hypothetical protein
VTHYTRTYLTFEGIHFPPTTSVNQSFQAGERICFNYFTNVVGPNPIQGVGTLTGLYLEPDFSPDTQQRMLAKFRRDVAGVKKKHPNLKFSPSTLMAGDHRWDTVYGWTEDANSVEGWKPLMLNQSDVDALHSGSKIAFVLVELAYMDMGKLHHARICQFLQTPSEAPGVWHFCEVFRNPD